MTVLWYFTPYVENAAFSSALAYVGSLEKKVQGWITQYLNKIPSSWHLVCDSRKRLNVASEGSTWQGSKYASHKALHDSLTGKLVVGKYLHGNVIIYSVVHTLLMSCERKTNMCVSNCVVLVAFLTLASGQGQTDDPLVVKTTQGYLRGSILTSRKGVAIYSYRGVRFAQPPVGILRFKVSCVLQAVSRGQCPCAQTHFSRICKATWFKIFVTVTNIISTFMKTTIASL